MSGDQLIAKPKCVLVAGASGTIGRAVVKALLAHGHKVIALLLIESGKPDELEGAVIERADLFDDGAIMGVLDRHDVETVISCIASRSGSSKDAERVDFDVNLVLMEAAEAGSPDHFILLSAICVQRPRLAFQRAKIVFESALRSSSIDYTIVHPTAFFKSLSGQVNRVLAGKPFLLFGDGELTRCKPISDNDLARFIAECVADVSRRNQTLPIGGPGPAISLKEQGELLFEAAGMKPRFQSIPPGLFKGASALLSLGAGVSEWFAEKAEYARIAHYYATESMLVFDQKSGEYDADATPEFGEDRLIDHYRALVAERRSGGQAP